MNIPAGSIPFRHGTRTVFFLPRVTADCIEIVEPDTDSRWQVGARQALEAGVNFNGRDPDSLHELVDLAMAAA